MKRFLCIALIFILCLGCISVSAEKDDYLSFHVEPASGSEAVVLPSDTVSLKFYVSAKSSSFEKDFKIEKIVNCSTNKAISESEISVSGTKNREDIGTFDVSVNSADVGKKIEFELFWQDSDGQHSTKTAVDTVAFSPKVSVSANVSSDAVVPGESVTVTYEVTNKGNVPISFVTVTDPAISALAGKDYIFKMKNKSTVLPVGEVIEESVTVKPNSDISVAPVVTFEYNGTVYEEKCSPSVIEVNEIIPTLSINAEAYSVSELNGSLNFNYTVKNSTSTVLKNIKVYNGDTDDAQVVYSVDSLNIGEEITGIFSLNITKSGFYKLKVLYSYDGASSEKEVSAKTLKAVRLPGEVSLSVASVVPSTITSPGEITFRLRIENKANSPLKDVTISEASNLAKKTSVASVISAGTPDMSSVYDRDVTVVIPADNTVISFILTYHLDDEEYALKLDYNVKFDAPLETTEPQSTFIPAATGAPIIPVDPTPSGNNGLVWIIVGSAILLALACGIVFLLVLKGNISGLAPIPSVKRSADEIFEPDDSNTLFDVSDDAEDDEDVKIFNKDE